MAPFFEYVFNRYHIESLVLYWFHWITLSFVCLSFALRFGMFQTRVVARGRRRERGQTFNRHSTPSNLPRVTVHLLNDSLLFQQLPPSRLKAHAIAVKAITFLKVASRDFQLDGLGHLAAGNCVLKYTIWGERAIHCFRSSAYKCAFF